MVGLDVFPIEMVPFFRGHVSFRAVIFCFFLMSILKGEKYKIQVQLPELNKQSSFAELFVVILCFFV